MPEDTTRQDKTSQIKSRAYLFESIKCTLSAFGGKKKKKKHATWIFRDCIDRPAAFVVAAAVAVRWYDVQIMLPHFGFYSLSFIFISVYLILLVWVSLYSEMVLIFQLIVYCNPLACYTLSLFLFYIRMQLKRFYQWKNCASREKRKAKGQLAKVSLVWYSFFHLNHTIPFILNFIGRVILLCTHRALSFAS